VVEMVRVDVDTAYGVPKLRDMHRVKGGVEPILCMPLLCKG
jgi:hypothetical protein